MKVLYVSKLIKCSVALIISLNVGNTALAQYPENVMMPGMAQFEELDINNDGRVSKEEIRRKNESVVKSMDLNGDQNLSAEELMRQHSQRAKFYVTRMIKRLDADSDGELSFGELKNSRHVKNLTKMFDLIDKNDDGFINKREVQNAKNAYQR